MNVTNLNNFAAFISRALNNIKIRRNFENRNSKLLNFKCGVIII